MNTTKKNINIIKHEDLTGKELFHYGILGQKWGIRKYQNPDGTYTEEGKRRYFNSDGRKFFAPYNMLKEKWNKKYSELIKKYGEVGIKRSNKGVDKLLETYGRRKIETPWNENAMRHPLEEFKRKIEDQRKNSGYFRTTHPLYGINDGPNI